ncbi:hypothetical protein CORC01_08452 [Colletotrichum orchidophilum]|uniref:Uncharacterized protein n=1 Tax=Colletotrichum orchidophilum TaxID=1209926 RepID=A0A1G4B4A9_9PEZI|nr:uncharacterized protein CORC01_08452 [Colletotrichum orchidophilum]OHE96234.1 hypothetical protein CORC01_08452 [Colletotrichum orchidophilum]
MKSTPALLALSASLANAVDMASYEASPGVDAAFANFVSEYYLVSEDKAATTSFTNFWPSDGKLILAGRTFSGYTAMLAVKQSLLPPNGNKSWWHLIRGATVSGETDADKTFVADIVIQTTYVGGNCSQAYGNASFTVLKDAQGVPRLEPHSESLSVYNLTVSTTESPTDIPCSSS